MYAQLGWCLSWGYFSLNVLGDLSSDKGTSLFCGPSRGIRQTDLESPAPTNVGTKVLDVQLLLLYYEGGYFFYIGVIL